MLLLHLLPVSCFLAIQIYAQVLSSSSALVLSGTNAVSIPNLGGDLVPTGSEVSYLSYSSTILVPSSTITSASVNGSMVLLANSMAAGNASGSSSTGQVTSTPAVMLLTGAVRSTSTTLNGTIIANGTVTTSATSSTSTSAQPTNTQPCNNYPQFCARKYSNITEVAAHNSPFVRPGSAASNQELGVIAQLNDGIRMRKPPLSPLSQSLKSS